MRLFDMLKPLALFVLRLSIGVIFVQQGYLKLFVSRAIFLKLFPSWGFPAYFTYVAGALEFFAGFEHHAKAFFVLKIDTAIGIDR